MCTKAVSSYFLLSTPKRLRSTISRRRLLAPGIHPSGVTNFVETVFGPVVGLLRPRKVSPLVDDGPYGNGFASIVFVDNGPALLSQFCNGHFVDRFGHRVFPLAIPLPKPPNPQRKMPADNPYTSGANKATTAPQLSDEDALTTGTGAIMMVCVPDSQLWLGPRVERCSSPTLLDEKIHDQSTANVSCFHVRFL